MNIFTARRLIRSIKRTQELNSMSKRTAHDVGLDEYDIIRKYADQKGKCYWSTLFLDERYNKKSYHPFAISIDRIDGGLGYTYDNVVLVYRLFNLGRGQFNAKEFPQIVSKLMEMMNARPVQGSNSSNNADQTASI